MGTEGFNFNQSNRNWLKLNPSVPINPRPH